MKRSLKLLPSLLALITLSACSRKHINSKVFTYPIEVQGYVCDTKGKQPLPGATIRNKRTQKIIATNSTGFFKANAQESDVLVFTYIGFITKEISMKSLAKQDTIQVFLEEDTQILETPYITAVRNHTTKKISIFTRFWRGLKKLFNGNKK